MGEGKRKVTAAAPQPSDPRAAIARAVDLLRSGLSDQAKAVCEPLFDAGLSDPEALHHLGYLGIELGQADRAVGVLQRAIGLQPEVPYFYNTLGIAFHRLGRQAPATEAFQRVIALAPTLHEPFNNLGNALLAQARYADAVALAYRARFPSNPALDDLSNWHAFEHAEPETCSGMYQFWVRHRP